MEGLIYTGALDLDRFTAAGTIDAEALREQSCGRALDILHGLAEARGARTPRLWLVTRGAQAVGATAGTVAVSQTPLWGMARVIAVEFQELNCVCIDLDPTSTGGDGGLLFQEVWSGSNETQLAYRGETRHAAKLRRLQQRGPTTFVAKPDGAYLVTGGLGGLGLRLAQWLVNRGARRLVLTGRRAPSPEAAQSIRELEADGARVLIVQADVGRREDVRRLLGQIDAEMPPLCGIFHAAGVLDDGILRQQTRARFATVMAPKVEGAWNLHELTRDRPLDLFVMFSSAASLVGSPGQGNYAAANAFLDGLAHLRRAAGLPGLSINWGGWAEVGMAAELDRRQGKSRDAAGVGRIDPIHGLATLERLLGGDTAQAGVLPIDWVDFFEPFPVGLEPAWLSEMVQPPRIDGRGGRLRWASGTREIARGSRAGRAPRRRAEFCPEEGRSRDARRRRSAAGSPAFAQ